MSYRNPLHGLDSDGNPEHPDQREVARVKQQLADLAFTPDDTGIDLPLDEPDGMAAPTADADLPHGQDPGIAGTPDGRTQAERLIALTRTYAHQVGVIMGEIDPPPKVADRATELMRAATGHNCPACPTSVRNLHAVAWNAAQAIRAALSDRTGWTRAERKLAELEQVLVEFQDISASHFAALDGWRNP